MRFLADMGVSLKVVDWLRPNGHDVVHLRDQGLQKLPDEAIFAKAFVESRIILTFEAAMGRRGAAPRNLLPLPSEDDPQAT